MIIPHTNNCVISIGVFIQNHYYSLMLNMYKIDKVNAESLIIYTYTQLNISSTLIKIKSFINP